MVFQLAGRRRANTLNTANFGRGGGDRKDKLLNKACALNALQPPPLANWNKRNRRQVPLPSKRARRSCAQGRRTIFWKSFLFNLKIENKRVRKISGSGTMYGNVPPHASSPPNFPHSEAKAKL